MSMRKREKQAEPEAQKEQAPIASTKDPTDQEQGEGTVRYPDRMLRWFECDHLPPPLKSISMNFQVLAYLIVSSVEKGPERTTALRKLLEAKDCAVRATLSPGG